MITSSFVKFELKTLEKSILIIYNRFLQNLFAKLKIKVKFFSLPKITKKFTLLKSPHVYKKSREQFQFNSYKQILTITSGCTPSFLKYLILNKPAEIKLTIKL